LLVREMFTRSAEKDAPPAVDATLMPSPPIVLILVSLTFTEAAAANANVDAIRGELVDLAIVDDQSLAGKKADAVEPRAEAIDVEAAKRDLVRRSGVHDDGIVPETSTPAVTPSQAIVIAFVIVTPPKPPGSSQTISPPAAVFEIAPGKVLHGAVRLHGLASSPTPETQVRVACA